VMMHNVFRRYTCLRGSRERIACRTDIRRVISRSIKKIMAFHPKSSSSSSSKTKSL